MLATSKPLSATHGAPRHVCRLTLLMLLLAAPAYSQSLADIARQERQRKQEQQPPATHVYDNDDLSRAQILLPEDRKRIEAAKKKAKPAASQPAVESAGGDPQPIGRLPLGDIARHYRALQKDRRDAELPSQALRHLPDAPLLASPAFSRPPLRPSAPPAPLHAPSAREERAADPIRRAPIAAGGQILAQPGDSLWKLAEKYLGRGTDWPLLAAANPQLSDPTRLQVGTPVHLPDAAANPPLSTSVRVQRGDSLWKLTHVHFGNAQAWNCIAQANPQLQNANLIFPGQVLTIPDTCTTPEPGTNLERTHNGR
jgi:nucleoid-associated protein YgaU